MERSADTTFQMAPRNEGGKPVENLGDTLPECPERDIEEIEAVNDSLDSLSSALDFIEKRTDDIKAQLLELLNSNREIRQSFLNENSKK